MFGTGRSWVWQRRFDLSDALLQGGTLADGNFCFVCKGNRLFCGGTGAFGYFGAPRRAARFSSNHHSILLPPYFPFAPRDGVNKCFGF
jgi:hypothetical protein